MDDSIYERVIYVDDEKAIQIRWVINEFRGVEYLHLRKYYLDFEGDWKPSLEGVSMPLNFDNSRELFTALIDTLSLAESKEILEAQFKEQLDTIYVR